MDDVIRVLLVDDDPLVRSGLRVMLGGAKQLAVVARSTTAAACWPRSIITGPTWC